MSHQPASASGPKARGGYFPDLDGLRAVAVLVVVAYHAGLPGIKGGFIGVDIFFVLSGFFITAQLARDVDERRFSLARFYERRARRILPALYFAMAGTCAAAITLMVPDDLVTFARSLIGAVLFAANIVFWQDTSYFAQEAATKPLLHLWSLAVEEQFYFIFPLVLVVLARFGRRTILITVALATVVSFAGSAILSPRAPAAAFFLLPTRTWELMLGALLALAPRRDLSPGVRDVLSLSGLALIAAGLLLISSDDFFPGWIAILPTGGAALLIAASLGGGGVGNRMLSVRPMVAIGLISYSLYLWHWPILALTRYAIGGDPRPVTAMICVAASFAMAIVSWRFVERPFRGAGSKVSARSVTLFAVMGAAALLGTGSILLMRGGMPERFAPAAARYMSAVQPPAFAPCFNLAPELAAQRPLCHIGAPGRPVRAILWGDSHAFRFGRNVDRLGRSDGFSALLLTHSSCPPLSGVNYGRDPKDCRLFADQAMRVITRLRPGMVILDARWTAYAEGTYVNAPQLFSRLTDDRLRPRTSEGNRIVYARALARTVSTLRALGMKVLIIGPVPGSDGNAPRTLAIAEQWNLPLRSEPATRAILAREAPVLAPMRQLAALPGVAAFYPHLALCNARVCRIASGGNALYMDDNHLSDAGNDEIHPAFAKAFRTFYSAPAVSRGTNRPPDVF